MRIRKETGGVERRNKKGVDEKIKRNIKTLSRLGTKRENETGEEERR